MTPSKSRLENHLETAHPISIVTPRPMRPDSSVGRLLRRSLVIATAGLALATAAFAHSVHQREMTLFLADETIRLLEQRADGTIPGGAGLRNGDVIHVLFQSTPVTNSASQGSGAYMTMYIPDGFEVVDAGMVDWNRNPIFVFESVPPQLPGPMPDGCGRGCNGAPEGSLAALYGDTGIFFSNDPRTCSYANTYCGGTQPPPDGTWIQPNPQPSATGQLLGIMGQAQARIYNEWDRQMVQSYSGVLSGGNGNTPFGYGSPVAGSLTYYQNDYRKCGANWCANGDATAVGPWQRIRYGGSKTATGGVGPGTNQVRRVSVPTDEGWRLSAANPAVPGSPTGPLPSLNDAPTLPTNAVRYMLGERTFGLVETVRISMRVVDATRFDANGCFDMFGDVFGGDASGPQDGKDHPWRYAIPGFGRLNSCNYLFKNAPLLSAPNATIAYTISYKNVSAMTLNNVQIQDALPANVTFLSATPAPTSVALPNLFWNLGNLASGADGVITVNVRIGNNPGDFSLNQARMTSTQYPTPALSNSMTRFQNAPNLDAWKTVTPSAANPGDIVTYTVTIKNKGLGPTAPGTRISAGDTLPPNFTAIAGTGTWVLGPTCPFGPTADDPGWQTQPPLGLCAGDSWTITFQARVGAATPAGVYYNAVTGITATSPTGGQGITFDVFNQAPVLVGLPSFNDLTVTPVDPTGVPIAGTLDPGDRLCYNIDLTNGAPTAAATNVVLIVPVPDEFSQLDLLAGFDEAGSSPPADFSTTLATGPFGPAGAQPPRIKYIRFRWPSIAARAQQLPKFCVNLDSSLIDNTELVVQAVATTAETQALPTPFPFPSDDPRTTAPDDPTSVTVRALPDLSSSLKSVDSTCAVPGETLTFTISASETGTSFVGATNVIITDLVDAAGLTNVSLLPIPPPTPQCPAAIANSVGPPATWFTGALAQGSACGIGFTAMVRNPFPGGGGTISNFATLRADQQPAPVNTNTVVINVRRPDFAQSIKQVTPGVAQPGDLVTYTIRVTENGTFCRPMVNVRITDMLDIANLGNIACGPSNPPGALCSFVSPTMSWTIASMAPGTSVDLTFTARITPGPTPRTVTNIAGITSAEQPTVLNTPPVVVLVHTCGDSNTEPGEQCDDGNTSGNDQCSSVCLFTVCGDGVTQRPNGTGTGGPVNNGQEDCDGAGETASCDADCSFAICGDGTVNTSAGELCDTGGESPTCNANCTPARCGDGVLNPTSGETCEDGNNTSGDGCSATCVDEDGVPTCGNVIIEIGEQCDTGGETATCNANCTLARCGDGILNPTAGETCEDGNNTDGDGCSASCVDEDGMPTCGNVIIEVGEQCDTGGETATCNADCTLARCGDGVLNPTAGETCEDGNNNSGDGCSATCLDEVPGAVCGNSILEIGEECDDGNILGGDGCDSTCHREGNCIAGSLRVLRPLLAIRVGLTATFSWPTDLAAIEYHLNAVPTKAMLVNPTRPTATAECTVTALTCNDPVTVTTGVEFYQILSACASLTEGPF